MTDTFYYCPFCETSGEGSHECLEQAWSAAMGRHDLEDSRGWEGGFSGMGSEDCGDWVRWEDARALLHVKQDEIVRLRAVLAGEILDKGEGGRTAGTARQESPERGPPSPGSALAQPNKGGRYPGDA